MIVPGFRDEEYYMFVLSITFMCCQIEIVGWSLFSTDLLDVMMQKTVAVVYVNVNIFWGCRHHVRSTRIAYTNSVHLLRLFFFHSLDYITRLTLILENQKKKKKFRYPQTQTEIYEIVVPYVV